MTRSVPSPCGPASAAWPWPCSPRRLRPGERRARKEAGAADPGDERVDLLAGRRAFRGRRHRRRDFRARPPGRASKPAAGVQMLEITDVETKIAALVGTRADDLVVHDLAVDPLSYDIYLAIFAQPRQVELAVERAERPRQRHRAGQDPPGRQNRRSRAGRRAPTPAPSCRSRWRAAANTRSRTASTPAPKRSPTSPGTTASCGSPASRTKNSPPPSGACLTPSRPALAGITTVENYHVAHQKWETAAPVRTLVAHQVAGKSSLIAAYLCTPLVVYATGELKDGAARARPHGERAGLRQLSARHGGGARQRRRPALPGQQLPADDVDQAQGHRRRSKASLTEPAKTYTSGVTGHYRPAGGVQQLDVAGGSHLVLLRRVPSGALDLDTWQLAP